MGTDEERSYEIVDGYGTIHMAAEDATGLLVPIVESIRRMAMSAYVTAAPAAVDFDHMHRLSRMGYELRSRSRLTMLDATDVALLGSLRATSEASFLQPILKFMQTRVKKSRSGLITLADEYAKTVASVMED